jgi:transcriptional regulator with AAA-type ATPase domain
MEDDKSLTETRSKTKYIIPPGLRSYKIMFKAHYATAKGEPILVVGATGVGKSLFLHIFEKLWKKEHPDSPIIWANCAHFGGPKSDPNIARSELFGMTKEYAGLIGKKNNKDDIKGLVEIANGGALVLEEIGELPLEVQAMLLTFIETREYRRVGETKKDMNHAKVSIIGATNREDALRDDFRYRFFSFYVPSIYERRGDVLYYLYNKYPLIVKRLNPFDVLALLAHNWPGNVREIERVGMLSERQARASRLGLHFWYSEDKDSSDYDSYLHLSRYGSDEFFVTSGKIDRRYYDMSENNVDVKSLEILLNRLGVGLDKSKQSYPFETLSKIDTKIDRILDVQEIMPYKPFMDAMAGYEILCVLFFQNQHCNNNPFDYVEDYSLERFSRAYLYPNIGDERNPIFFEVDPFLQFRELMIPIFNYLSGLKLPTDTIVSKEYKEKMEFFKELARKHPSNKFLSPLAELIKPEEKDLDATPDIFSMHFDDFMKNYYKKLIESVGGNKAEAARKINVNYQTLQTRLKIYGVK